MENIHKTDSNRIKFQDNRVVLKNKISIMNPLKNILIISIFYQKPIFKKTAMHPRGYMAVVTVSRP
jgi:hypothetical protein